MNNMDGYSRCYSSSSKSSSYLLSQINPGKAKRVKLQTYPSQSENWLHSTRKSSPSSSSSQAKPWKNKAPIAPAMPPKPVKVYKVDALNFRELVQHLTGARASSVDVAMPQNDQNLLPRDIAAPLRTTNWYYQQGFQSEAFGLKSQEDSIDGVIAPAASYSRNWCSFPPLSPGTITSLEPNRVL